jgi:hypothetical protein
MKKNTSSLLIGAAITLAVLVGAVAFRLKSLDSFRLECEEEVDQRSKALSPPIEIREIMIYRCMDQKGVDETPRP